MKTGIYYLNILELLNKILAFFLILILALFLGGIYGIIHDQITYFFSEEYYTKFKFAQFGLENWGLGQNIGTNNLPEIKLQNPRFGVSIIGFLSTWWVGLIIGIFLGLIAFINRNGREMIIIVLKAILITISIALIFGLFGLLYGKLFLVNNNPNWFLPEHLENRAAFIMVGSMHNFSYLGGFLGMCFGAYSIIRTKRKHKIKN